MTKWSDDNNLVGKNWELFYQIWLGQSIQFYERRGGKVRHYQLEPKNSKTAVFQCWACAPYKIKEYLKKNLNLKI